MSDYPKKCADRCAVQSLSKEASMAQPIDQLAAFNKAQMEAALKMAEAAAAHMEKLAEVQLNAAKAAYANSLNALRQLAAVKDADELTKLTQGIAQPAWEEAAAYAKNLYKAVAAAQAEFAANLEEQVADSSKKMMSALDAAMKSAPGGSETAFAAAKSAVESTRTVYETMVKAAKQMAGLAEAAAASQTKPARRK
jgi:phasin family protein